MNNMKKQPVCVAYMLDVQNHLLEAYVNPNCFEEALKLVEDYMCAEAAFMWLTKRDSKRKSWYFASEKHPFLENVDFRVRYPDISQEMQKNGRIEIGNKEMLQQQFPQEGTDMIAVGVTNLILIPVYWINGKLAFTMGVLNFREDGADPDALHLVASSFLMALNHYDNYHVLNKMGKIDIMTGLMNRNSYHMVLANLTKDKPQSMGCVYIDVNGLHEVNNYLGHHAGDEMLRTVSRTILKHFDDENAFRIGGDEFVLLCKDWEWGTLCREMEQVRQELFKSGYEISVGIHWSNGNYQLDDIVNEAENKMRLDKQEYYARNGKYRNIRHINEQMERLLDEKRNADMFLSVLEPEFKGVYFVDLDSDTVRHIFIPKYFEEVLSEVGDIFSDAMLEYARRYAEEEFFSEFERVCNYELLRTQLDRNELPGFVYRKKDGEYLRLSIVKLQAENGRTYRTLWIFKDPDVVKI